MEWVSVELRKMGIVKRLLFPWKQTPHLHLHNSHPNTQYLLHIFYFPMICLGNMLHNFNWHAFNVPKFRVHIPFWGWGFNTHNIGNWRTLLITLFLSRPDNPRHLLSEVNIKWRGSDPAAAAVDTSSSGKIELASGGWWQQSSYNAANTNNKDFILINF